MTCRIGGAEVTNWRKSTRSHAANGCVEVGSTAGYVGVRDSKLGSTSPILTFTRAGWAAFTAALRNGHGSSPAR